MLRLRLTLPAIALGSLTLTALLASPAAATVGSSGQAAARAIAVQGTVPASRGQSDAGVTVMIHAWPDQSIMEALKPGQEVPWTLAGTATTDASGKFSVSLALAKLRPEASYGVVNLEADTSSASYSFPVVVRENKGNSYLAKADQVANLIPTHVKAADGRAAGVPCGWGLLRTYKPSWTVVGGTYSTNSHVVAKFSYDNGQSSSLGVGQSSSGKKGSFSESGTDSFSSSSGEDFRPSSGHASILYETKFIDSEFGYSCGSGIITYQTRPTDYAGGARSVKTSAPKANYCVYQQADSTFRKHTTSAYTFGVAFTIPVIDLSLSAQTGYDADANLSYHFARPGRMCGTNAYPGQAPKRLEARPLS